MHYSDFDLQFTDQRRRDLAQSTIAALRVQAGEKLTAVDQLFVNVAGDMRVLSVAEMLKPLARTGDSAASALLSNDLPAIAAAGAHQSLVNNWPRLIANLAWTAPIPVANYNPQDILIGSPGKLQPNSEASKIRPVVPTIASEKGTITCYAGGISLSETTFRADTSGILAKVAAQMVLSAAAALADECFGLLTQNPTMADGDPWLLDGVNKASVGVALDQTSLGAAIAALRRQKWGELVASPTPRYLLTGPDNELLAATLLRDSGLGIERIVDARLDGWGFALFADPTEYPAAARLNLAQDPEPQMTVEKGFKTNSLVYKIVFDCGAVPLSRCGVYWTPAP